MPSYANSPMSSNANPYTSSSTNPVGSTLQGVADVTTASGNSSATEQRARLSAEEVKGSRIDNRRKLIDEIRYERMLTPSAEDLRQQKLTGLQPRPQDPRGEGPGGRPGREQR
jgi:hypothetical protein